MTTPCPVLTRDRLKLDCAATSGEISKAIRNTLARFHRRGVVVALSGGVDSSVTAALCVRAIGAQRVFGVHMPERDSAADTLTLSKHVSDHLGLASVVEDITPVLNSVGCYRRQEDSIRLVIPQYGPGWKSKVVIEGALRNGGFTYFNVVAQSPEGQIVKQRLNSDAYLGIVAATNFKQRVRKMIEYYHADRLNYAVAGTPNRLEYDQGFFVKLGDGAADLKPIAHLYKSQVYQLAEYLGIPEQVRRRRPTTDTYSLPRGRTNSTSRSPTKAWTSACSRETTTALPTVWQRWSA
jgi:NAD+ synthase